MLEQKLMDIILHDMSGLVGNNFIPYANHGGHNYRTNVAHEISRSNPGRGSIRGLRPYQSNEEGNSISLNEEARVVYTKKGVDNILSTVASLKASLEVIEAEYLQIKKKTEKSGSYDPKTEKLEEMLVLLREKDTDPAVIVDKLLKAVNSNW